jgi:cysteine-rich repeat protein
MLLVLALALGALFVGHAQAAPIFGPTTSLSTDPGAYIEPELATDGAGTWIAVWVRQYNTTDVMLSRSTDNGATWSPAIALNPNANPVTNFEEVPQVVTDRLGTWVVAWMANCFGEDNDIAFVRSTDGGQTWSLPAPINTTATVDVGYDGFPRVTTDRAGNWVAVWQAEESIAGDSGFLVARSSDNGATWQPPTVLDASISTADQEPVLATDRHGTWIAHWAHYSGTAGTLSIMFSRSLDKGETWSPPETLSTSTIPYPGFISSTDLVTDGTTWIASWASAVPGPQAFHVMSARSIDEGMHWSSPIMIGLGYIARLATDGTRWLAVWEDCASSDACGGSVTTDTDYDIYVSESLDAGITWSPQTTVNTNAPTDVATDAEPQVETDGAGTWIVVWRADVLLYARQACGDGLLGFDEACDDGNVVAGDGCDATCHLEPPMPTVTPTPTSTPTTTPTPTCGPTPHCGNGIREGTEECDTGNSNGALGVTCSASCTCLAPHVDLDGDGVFDGCDNCPNERNPDQRNMDCTGNPTLDPGCLDGDVCDPCPARKVDTDCDHALSGGQSIGTGGGTLTFTGDSTTTPPNATVTVTIPPGALCAETSISLTNRKGPEGAFMLEAGKYYFGPNKYAFDQPVTVRLTWTYGGSAESTQVLKRDSARFSKDGFFTPTVGYSCADHDPLGLSGNCPNGGAPHAVCTDNAGQNCSSVARACSQTGNEWTFETCDFSSLVHGEPTLDLVPGGGSATTDCMLEWIVDDLFNQPAVDRKGLPSRTQTCTDGDVICDADGVVDGVCTFRVGLCLNVPDARLVKHGVPVCSASDIAVWEIKKPKPTSSVAVEAANAVALRSAVAALGTATVGGKRHEVLTFAPPIAGADVCTELVEIAVPLEGGTATRAKMSARATATALPGQGHGTRDSDTLKLVCLPSAG